MTFDVVRASRDRATGVPGLAVVAAGLMAAAVVLLVLPGKWAVTLLLVAVVGLVAATRLDLAVAIYVFVLFTEAAHVSVVQGGTTLVGELLAGLLLLAHLGDPRAAGRRSGVARVVLVVLPFMLWSLTSFYWAAFPGAVVGRFSDHLRFLAIMLILVITIRTERTLRFAVWGIIAGGAFLGLVAVVQAVTRHAGGVFFFGFGGVVDFRGQDAGPGGQRVVGPLGDPNFFAQRMVVVLPFAIERAVRERRTSLRLFAIVTVLIVIATIVLTQSRGGALAMALVVLICLFHFMPVRRALVVLGVMGAVSFLVVPSGYVDRVLALRGVTSVATSTETSVRGRTSAIIVGLNMLHDHPMSGVGTQQYPAYYADYAKEVGLDAEVGRAPHNLYIEIASENGLIGVVLFGGMLVAAMVSAGSAIQRLRRSDQAQAAELVWAARASLLGYLAAALFLHFAYATVLYALIALCLAAPFLVVPNPIEPRSELAEGDLHGELVDA